MSYILDKAVEGYDQRLALFNVPPVETAIQDVYIKDYRPIGQISRGSTLEFDIPNNSSDYIILNEISMLLSLQIYSDKNEKVGATNDVTLINLPASAHFRQVDLSIQQQVITSSVGSNYPYKAIFDTLLESGKSDQETWLTLAGYYKDTAGGMDGFNAVKNSTNSGLSSRHHKTKTGKKAIFKSKLFVDICQQKRLLLNGLPINIKLYPGPDLFSLMHPNIEASALAGSKSYYVHIDDATILVPYARIHPGMLMAQSEMLKKEMALYPFTRSEVKGYNIPKGNHSWMMDNLFQDAIPKRLVIGLVKSSAYSGANQLNPFNFDTMSVNYLDFTIDGQSCKSQVLQPDFENDNYVQSYSKLFDCMPPNQKEPPEITYYDYKHGYALYVFDLENSKDVFYSNPLRRGQTRLTVKFGKALVDPTTIIVYGTFEALMKVDQVRNVIIES